MIDSIGCITTPKDFAVAGTAADKLYGIAEGLWEPDLVCCSYTLVALDTPDANALIGTRRFIWDNLTDSS